MRFLIHNILFLEKNHRLVGGFWVMIFVAYDRINSMRNISILGYGELGKAIGSLLNENKIGFSHADAGEKIQNKSTVVFICVPANFIREALEFNKNSFDEETIFVNCSKGLEQKTGYLPFQIVDEIIGTKNYNTMVGLSFAKEIIEKQPTLITLGYSDKINSETIKELVRTKYFSVEETPHYKSLELASIMKNAYAILCGFSDGLNFGTNTKSKIVTLALREYETLANKMEFEYDTLALSGIIGDFVFTCSTKQSRNYSFGFDLSKMSVEDVRKKYEEKTIEGQNTIKSILELANKHKIKLIIAELTNSVIENGSDFKEDFKNLIGIII
ncbi:MAG: glycerol-3-phosphate dehydrogenase (NAD(P)+) [Parcubacteria group bacterium Athens0714_16]|nr:MAG: glycerol-3-phosphate dehydrogenase (NAD(P)+) [Parcubacteria group bacterium Athens0714_16]